MAEKPRGSTSAAPEAAPPPRRAPAVDSVAGWLRSLDDEAVRWGPAEDHSAPPPPAQLGPLELSPAPEAETPSDGRPLAEAFFEAALRASRHMPQQPPAMLTLAGNLRRYLRFTREKLAHLYQALKPKERAAFSAIPYLLHVNLSGLPGYIKRAPCGIACFDLNLTIRGAAEELLARRGGVGHAVAQPAIRALLAMGSVGTIGQSGKSDVDYWVLVDEGSLNPEAMRLLGQKVKAIEAWAHARGLDAHFFVMETQRTYDNDFGGAEEDVDSSGSAQGKLLKEEFYRTAVFISGQIPLWWIVPVGLDAAGYARVGQALRLAALPAEIAFIDLGFIGQIDQGEFFGAALWQINKSLHSPFKSLLKMALLTRYLDATRPRLLCDELKSRVLSRPEDADEATSSAFTDPYVLLFDAISEYFSSQGDWAAFRLVQKCFYLKVGMKLSRERVDRTKFLRRFRVMQAYINRWGWDADLIAELDTIESWSAEKVDQIGQQIRTFMLSLYRRLTQRVRAATVHINETDITLLGRRLFAVFGRESGKIHHLFTYFLKEPRREERLAILEVHDAPPQRRWEIHRELHRDRLNQRAEPIWAGDTVARVAGWLTFNGLFYPGTVVGLISTHSRVNTADFRHMLERFHAVFQSPDPFSIPPPHFLARRRTLRVALVINFEQPRDPADVSDIAGVHYLPENWDILNYGRRRACQLTDISTLTLNSWGEVFCHRDLGPKALLAVMRTIFTRLEAPLEEEPVILAPSDRMLPAIRNRLGGLLKLASTVLLDPLRPRESRIFVYEVGGRFQIIQRNADGPLLCGAPSLRGVLRLLGNARYDKQVVFIDRLSPSLSDLRVLAARHARDQHKGIYVAWRKEPEIGRLIVCDELRRLYAREVPVQDLDRVLLSLLRRTLLRLRISVQSTRDLRRTLKVFELVGGRQLGEQSQLVDETGRLLAQLSQPREGHRELFLVGKLEAGRQGLGFRFNGVEFSPALHGRAYLYELVKAILKVRSPYDPGALEIDGSAVDFGPGHRWEGFDRGVVKHLRLIDLYERQLRRALAAYRSGGGAIYRSRRGFGREDAS
ncbi:class I adenylate cyclase [Myxococcota bacterium]|nr:class I adenylate cyclase [Myxococcota bacterium]